MNCNNYLVLLVVLQVVELPMTQVKGRLVVPLASIPSEKTCSGAVRETLQKFKSNLNDVLSKLIDIYTVPECGDGLWYRVAYLNMTDPSQQCPPAWREYNTSGVRACGRPASNDIRGSRPANFYTTDQLYNRVCGRAIGYQVGTTDGFTTTGSFIDQNYIDGISITYGQPRQHIWSYAAGHSEGSSDRTSSDRNCPCSPIAGSTTPTWIGRNYYCESGNPTNSFPLSTVYTNDRLWDGQQCEGTCCSGTNNSPPWFSVQLPTVTADRIEVRICADQPTTDEDVLIEVLEIYVQ